MCSHPCGWERVGLIELLCALIQNPARTSVAKEGGGGICPNKNKLEAIRSFGPNIKIVEFLMEFHTFLPNITGWVSVRCGEVPFLANLGATGNHHFSPD